MGRRATGAFVFLLLLPSVVRAAGIQSIAGPTATLPAGSLLEFRVVLDRSYPDPFDPAVVAVDAEVTGPAGETVRVAGFWSQDFGAHMEGAAEVLAPEGDPAFRVRYRPTVP